MTTYRVTALPGDGIGREVMSSAQSVLEELGRRFGFGLDWVEHDWSCEYYTRHGRMMPPDGLEQLAETDAILLGAVGYPGVEDHVSLWGLLLPIRRGFRQYVNLRPVRLLRGITSPVAALNGVPDDERLDLVCVRENNEGEYSEIGGRLYRDTPDEVAIQESVFTRRGVERVMRYAYELAGRRRGQLASATKSNGIIHTMPFWDQIFDELAPAYPGVTGSRYHVDALAALFVLDPGRFDVVVASNLFGDILTDLGAAVVGSIGIAPSANLNPEGDHPSMFEPVHGSAPDIAGQGIANPIGQLWSAALMVEHLGQAEAADALLGAIETVLVAGVRTPDLGGTATTEDVTNAITDALTGAVAPGPTR
ncbi:MAG: tartrate dehydrogenase [Nitriliruptoraceae bacterium]